MGDLIKEAGDLLGILVFTFLLTIGSLAYIGGVGFAAVYGGIVALRELGVL